MRLIVVTLVSVLGYSFADILKLKCGDELCQKPINRAVTTLKYSPDKPYKLPIISINTEIDIFGATEDLYYALYGRNYGFVPKHVTREISGGKYHHAVEINSDTIKVSKELRATNFLHEILKSSQENVPKEEIKVDGPNEQERPKEYIPIGTEPKIPNSEVNQTKTEELKEQQKDESNKLEQKKDDSNILEEPKVEELKSQGEVKKEEAKLQESVKDGSDSGIEDDEEEDDEEEDEEEEYEEFDVFDSQEKSNETNSQNPETTTAQPNVELKAETDTKSEKIEEAVLKFEKIAETDKKVEKIEEVDKKLEKIEEVDKKVEKIEETDKKVEKIEETDKKSEEFKETDKKPEELKEPEAKPQKNTVIDEKSEIKEVKIDTDEKKPAEEIKTEEIKEQPAILNEIESHTENATQTLSEKVEEKPADVPKTEIPEIIKEVTEPAPVTEEVIEELVPTEAPQIVEQATQHFELVTELPEIKSTEVPPTSQEKRKMDQDLLIKRFNEKLGHKSSEGVGSVEQVHKHQHSHEHSSHSHDNLHSHEHSTNDVKNDVVKIEEIVAEEDKKPGFFSGLVKTIFGDKHDQKEEKTDSKPKLPEQIDEGFCEKLDSENCPKSLKQDAKVDVQQENMNSKTIDEYFKIILHQTVEMMDVIITMGLVALTVLIFIFGHYCISKASKEGELIRKMNALERELMASAKENGSLKADADVSKHQLKSIQDNSFGSNDMVIALKNDLEFSEKEKEELLDKVTSLEKELEAAAEDGLELNRMVSELLNNQTDGDSIINSVEDLQKQLNEQQETIVTMNETLAAKSRENTELQIQLSDINAKFGGEYEKFQQQVDSVALERSNLQIELENLKRESDLQVNQIIEERNSEVTRLNSELTSYAGKYDENKKLLTAAESKVQALEECIDMIKKNKGGEIKKFLDVADLKADLLAVTKEKSTIQEQLQSERDSRKLLDDRVKAISEEMSNLKREFSVAEKEKLDAQTRLDVLSNYFKDKETQLQQELSVKEARWMKQQGETTSTVEKVQALNAEIQTLKSQNDELKAEFEAQLISYKTKLSSVEAQSHTAWLTAKQAERKLEESRMEAANLRRRLTSIAENPTGANMELLNGLPNDSMNSIPSPLRVESPNTINLPPPPLMMPPFLAGAPPFLPPPFMPGEMPPMGLPPLGRLMSPPPKRFTPTMRDDRYSPRTRYSPDSRYDDYTPFDTETDISPPRSPIPPRRGSDRNKKSKGGHNSEQPSRRK